MLKSKLFAAAAITIALTACSPAATPETTADAAPQVDAALAAINSAHPNNCPEGRVQANARSEGFGEHSGVTIDDLASVPMNGNNTLQLQRVTVAPGGIIGWHSHEQGQGMALLVFGEVTEARSTCLDTIAFKPGDITLEDAALTHAFRNDADVPAVFLVWGGGPAMHGAE